MWLLHFRRTVAPDGKGMTEYIVLIESDEKPECEPVEGYELITMMEIEPVEDGVDFPDDLPTECALVHIIT